jgi:hypothetical protein
VLKYIDYRAKLIDISAVIGADLGLRVSQIEMVL